MPSLGTDIGDRTEPSFEPSPELEALDKTRAAEVLDLVGAHFDSPVLHTVAQAHDTLSVQRAELERNDTEDIESATVGERTIDAQSEDTRVGNSGQSQSLPKDIIPASQRVR